MANNKVYVGNLAWSTSQDGLTQFFSQWGKVTESFVAVDKMSGRSKGFAFVTFSSDEEAATACQKANGQQLDGRALKVDIARPMEARPSGGGDRGDRRGGDRGSRGGDRW